MRVKCIKMNTKRPLLICRASDVNMKVTTPHIVELEAVDSEYKRSFSVRLLVALKGVVLGKKSIQHIEKPKRKYKRKYKKNK